MLTLKGLLINTFIQPKGVNKDGEEYGGQTKVQIIGDMPLPDGGHKSDMYTLTAHNPQFFQDLQGKEVTVPIGVLANRNQITYFIPKGAKPSAA